MEDDLYVSAKRATSLLTNIQEFLLGNPSDDAEWEDMSLRLEAIQREFVRLLKDNEIPFSNKFTFWDENNPYFID